MTAFDLDDYFAERRHYAGFSRADRAISSIGEVFDHINKLNAELALLRAVLRGIKTNYKIEIDEQLLGGV